MNWKDIAGFVIEVTAWIVAVIVAIAAFGFFMETKSEYDAIPVKTVTPTESLDSMYRIYKDSLEKGDKK